MLRSTRFAAAATVVALVGFSFPLAVAAQEHESALRTGDLTIRCEQGDRVLHLYETLPRGRERLGRVTLIAGNVPVAVSVPIDVSRKNRKLRLVYTENDRTEVRIRATADPERTLVKLVFFRDGERVGRSRFNDCYTRGQR